MHENIFLFTKISTSRLIFKFYNSFIRVFDYICICCKNVSLKCQQRKTVYDGLLFYCLKNIQLQASSTISGKRSKNRKTPSTQNVKKSQNKILSKYKMSLQFPLSFSTKIPSIKFPPTQFFTSLKGWRDKKRQILILLSKIRFYQFHLLHYYD